MLQLPCAVSSLWRTVATAAASQRSDYEKAATLKAERLHGERFKDEQELRLALAGYITQFYNRKRLHSSLDYMSPVEYEQNAA
jgi:transposase InsO family protein